MGQYKLYCPGCKKNFEDSFTNICPFCGNAGQFIRADYITKEFSPKPLPGFWKFLDWLPCMNYNDQIRSETVIYKSKGFASELGLKNLYIAFNGYWPEKNADMRTCTFKELEAPPTYQRAQEKGIKNLIIASAGNTAKAFIYTAQFFDVDLYVVVPRNNLYKLVLPIEVPENVTIIAVNHESDYTDSIIFAGRISNEVNIMPEGGARNIARRDGMGTVLLEGVHQMKRLPDNYFQAVGSGTGGIATYEMAQRLINSGKFGNRLPKLHLTQNKPFTPLTDAWNSGFDELIPKPDAEQRRAVEQVFAEVLTNRHPPYSVGGGVHDILKITQGLMYGVTNQEAQSIGKLFASTEEVDLVPAACVVTACLAQAVESDLIDPNEVILLNITGGGQERLLEDFEPIEAKADIVCSDTADMRELRVLLEGPCEIEG
jgi:cysteate synthase